jgi:hypothetical protein
MSTNILPMAEKFDGRSIIQRLKVSSRSQPKASLLAPCFCRPQRLRCPLVDATFDPQQLTTVSPLRSRLLAWLLRLLSPQPLQSPEALSLDGVMIGEACGPELINHTPFSRPPVLCGAGRGGGL